ncbi:MAG TPA: peptidylprolyl isomerase, partial [Ramlibacter sp.]|nr:peptidylprolyl isomerase [Ramlibacter sp.]
MKKVLLTAVAAAAIGIALPVAAQNIAIVNGKPVPTA